MLRFYHRTLLDGRLPERSHDGFSDPLGPTGNEDSSCFMECLRIVTGSCPGGFPDLILLVFFSK